MRNLLLSLFSHRTLALLRWDLHFIRLRLTSKLPRLPNSNPLYLNLGSGPRGISNGHWVNVDGFKDANVEYLADISRKLPFPDNTFHGIFSEHVFEHFDVDTGMNVLRECFRVLRPDGQIRLIMPDGEIILKSYIENPAALLAHRETETGLPMDAVNSYFRQRYEHQCIYDFEYLAHQLALAGFVGVKHCGYNEGTPELLLDDQRYEWESLYVEATKASLQSEDRV